MRIIIDINNIEDTDKIIELVQSNFPNSSIRKESASENMLRAMSEHKYNPNNDPAIKRLEDRLNRYRSDR